MSPLVDHLTPEQIKEMSRKFGKSQTQIKSMLKKEKKLNLEKVFEKRKDDKKK